jgi:hypothetical protein
MSNTTPVPAPSPAPASQQASLGTVLAEAVDGVVQAQRRLDQDAVDRATAYIGMPQGDLALPPLWYTFQQVNLELELAATMTRVSEARGPDKTGGVRFDCRLVNPAAVSLFGYAASSGFKVRLTLAPREAGSDVSALPLPPSPDPEPV